MSAEVFIETAGLEAVFARGDGVGPVDLVIRPGEHVLVLGPSGSGKSTLLRLLHGAVPSVIHARVTGSVRVAGRLVADESVAGLADVVGVVAQDPSSGVCLTAVADEVAFPLENLATDPALIPARMELALQRAGAAHLLERDTTELSGGELQRVALASAIASEPRVLLLDEPTSMLDSAGVHAVREALAAVGASTGAAVVLVEHRLDEFAADGGLAALPPRWVVLDRGGRVVHDGPADGLSRSQLLELLAAGCWLPMSLELDLMGESSPAETPRTAGGPVRLEARGLAVSAGGMRRRRSRGVPPLLTDIDLTLRAGEVTALVGRNGTGKSTLLTCLAGLVAPSSGKLDGGDCGLVFQNPEHQFARSTVTEEVALGLPAGSDARVAELLERFDLTDFAEHNPHQLSGGQKRRLSLAAMLVHDHACLLADEPTFGLDRRSAVAALRALTAAAEGGKAVMFSTHDPRALAAYAHRVVVIGHGRVLADTTPLTLLGDQELLASAGLRPANALRDLAADAADDHALRSRLQGIDDAVLALGARVAS